VARRFAGGRLVVATHNKGKLREIAALLRPFAEDVVAAGALGLPEPEETGTTFIANAELKARAAAGGAAQPALADDSGLVVPALDGAPGIFSARWAGPDKDFAVAVARVQAALASLGPAAQDAGQDAAKIREAHFVCALSLAWPDGHCESFEGTVHGHLVWPPRGTRGFGYDPLFVPRGHDTPFGEMEPAAKHAMSHRADAFRQLVAACFS
jgi:XTP/dITP diphosphohydrolase